jgi:hypothetical protein
MSILVIMHYVWNMMIHFEHIYCYLFPPWMHCLDPICFILSNTYLMGDVSWIGWLGLGVLLLDQLEGRSSAKPTTSTTTKPDSYLGGFAQEGWSSPQSTKWHDGENGQHNGDVLGQSTRGAAILWVSWFCANQPTNLHRWKGSHGSWSLAGNYRAEILPYPMHWGWES